jgi:hypothetical protein
MKCIKCGEEAKTSLCDDCKKEVAKTLHELYPTTYDEDGELIHTENRHTIRRSGIGERRVHAERRIQIKN